MEELKRAWSFEEVVDTPEMLILLRVGEEERFGVSEDAIVRAARPWKECGKC